MTLNIVRLQVEQDNSKTKMIDDANGTSSLGNNKCRLGFAEFKKRDFWFRQENTQR